MTGTTAITAITLAEGEQRTVRFTGALTLTNGASLVLPGAANITTAAGDFAVFRGYASSVVRCTSYVKATGGPIVLVTAAMLAATLDLSSKTITLPTANTPAFTKSYTSTNQTITSGGALTLAHSLGAMPSLIQVRLKCLTAEEGYSIGDEVIAPMHLNATDAESSRGVSVVPDATNLNIRFGSATGAFATLNKGTGAAATLTNGNWAAIFKAWV